MHLVDLVSSSLNALLMGSTRQYSVRGAFAGVLISMEMNCMELRRMALHNHLAQTNQHQVSLILIWSVEHSFNNNVRFM